MSHLSPWLTKYQKSRSFWNQIHYLASSSRLSFPCWMPRPALLSNIFRAILSTLHPSIDLFIFKFPIQVKPPITESARKGYHLLVQLRYIDYERPRAYEQRYAKGWCKKWLTTQLWLESNFVIRDMQNSESESKPLSVEEELWGLRGLCNLHDIEHCCHRCQSHVWD